MIVLYRNRNAIERMFCRLKDFRRVATRYDRNAVNYLAAVCIASMRVLPAGEADPWERGFDAPVTAEAEEVGEDTDEAVQVADVGAERGP